jgi:hypothetical protein
MGVENVESLEASMDPLSNPTSPAGRRGDWFDWITAAPRENTRWNFAVQAIPIDSLKSQSGRRSLLPDRVDLKAGETRLASR